jgi:hypothetical protein
MHNKRTNFVESFGKPVEKCPVIVTKMLVDYGSAVF